MKKSPSFKVATEKLKIIETIDKLCSPELNERLRKAERDLKNISLKEKTVNDFDSRQDESADDFNETCKGDDLLSTPSNVSTSTRVVSLKKCKPIRLNTKTITDMLSEETAPSQTKVVKSLFLPKVAVASKNSNITSNDIIQDDQIEYLNLKKNLSPSVNAKKKVFSKEKKLLMNLYGESPEYYQKIEKLRKEKGTLSLLEYQAKYMELVKGSMSRDHQILLGQKFKDVRNSVNVEFVKMSRKKHVWTETLNRIQHIIPDHLYIRLQNQK